MSTKKMPTGLIIFIVFVIAAVIFTVYNRSFQKATTASSTEISAILFTCAGLGVIYEIIDRKRGFMHKSRGIFSLLLMILPGVVWVLGGFGLSTGLVWLVLAIIGIFLMRSSLSKASPIPVKS